MSKYLLCIPHAGWNDQLSTIYKCFIYCMYNNRILLLYNNCIRDNEDGDHPNLNCIYNFDLSKYININLNNTITDVSIIEQILDTIPENEIFPYIPYYYDNELPKRLHRYFIHKDNKETIFDINQLIYNNRNMFQLHFEQRLLCFYDCGGLPNLDTRFLSCFVFKKNIKEFYEKRLNQLPEKYVAFHIRNTDRKCDYKDIFEKNKEYLTQPIFLATDSIEVIDYLKTIAKNSIYTFSKLHNDNKAIHHHHWGVISKEKRFIDMILDLLCVANADKYISSVGGFSTLCQTYFDNKFLLQFE